MAQRQGKLDTLLATRTQEANRAGHWCRTSDPGDQALETAVYSETEPTAEALLALRKHHDQSSKGRMLPIALER